LKKVNAVSLDSLIAFALFLNSLRYSSLVNVFAIVLISLIYVTIHNIKNVCIKNHDIYDINMIYLAIETSCDETAISIVETKNSATELYIHSNLVISQINIHQAYGGVFPAMAKREHSRNLVPLLIQALKEANLEEKAKLTTNLSDIEIILEREPELFEMFKNFLKESSIPNIDAIVVTQGPGLAPALWVGVNFARALSIVWNIPLIPVNHMEGHVSSVVLKSHLPGTENAMVNIADIQFPILSLLISGGHTQLIVSEQWGAYDIIGDTLDDAVGEAFDKVARMLGLPYPGGPELSRLASIGKEHERVTLPRPMLHSDNYSFSFSGLKTACRYLIEKLSEENLLDNDMKASIAREFQHAVTEVLVQKTKKALLQYHAHTLIIAGGVSANTYIRESFEHLISNECSDVQLKVPSLELCGDNSLMIASVAVLQEYTKTQKYINASDLKAIANLKISD